MGERCQMGRGGNFETKLMRNFVRDLKSQMGAHSL